MKSPFITDPTEHVTMAPTGDVGSPGGTSEVPRLQDSVADVIASHLPDSGLKGNQVEPLERQEAEVGSGIEKPKRLFTDPDIHLPNLALVGFGAHAWNIMFYLLEKKDDFANFQQMRTAISEINEGLEVKWSDFESSKREIRRIF